MHDPAQIVEELQKRWVWLPEWTDFPRNGEAARVVSFQRELHLDRVGQTTLFLSADTRYKLLINGRRVAIGPTRGYEQRWFYDTIEIGQYLRQGKNTILVYVSRYFPSFNGGWTFARGRYPGFTLFGHVGDIDVSTGEDWMSRECQEVVIRGDDSHGIMLHCFETVSPAGSLEWSKPRSTPDAVGFGILPNWRLEPRMIPMPEETAADFQSIRHVDSSMDIAAWTGFFEGKSLELPANSHHVVEVEFKEHNTAFLRLCAQGVGLVTITYAESYAGQIDGNTHKGDRTSREGQSLFGPSDRLRVDGVAQYEPFWWRTFRYLLLEISTEAPLVLESLTATQTNYPMNISASWASDAEFDEMWKISIRTLRNCMFDGYSDCPFYEQLQYCEDSRSAILFHYALSGDDRLARQAIAAFADSQLSDGMVCGRAPAHGTQVITGFSLFWVLQVCDHHLHFGDDIFAKRFVPQINAVLAWFERHVGGNGLVTGLPKWYWSFIDWVQTWQADEQLGDGGVPLSGRKTMTWSFFSMLYAFTLRKVATMMAHLGSPDGALLAAADRLVDAINSHCYDGAYLDSVRDESTGYSQHAQVWAVLSGCVKGEHARQILSRSFDLSFARTSYPMTHYMFRALSLTELYDTYFDSMWDPWRKMMALHLTTWAEDDVNERSDCHEWSSLPIYEFGYEVLGLTPLSPGWDTMLFAPRVKLLPRVKAAVKLGPNGLARVEWSTEGQISLKLPRPLHLISKLEEEVDHGRITEVDLSFH